MIGFYFSGQVVFLPLFPSSPCLCIRGYHIFGYEICGFVKLVIRLLVSRNLGKWGDQGSLDKSSLVRLQGAYLACFLGNPHNVLRSLDGESLLQSVLAKCDHLRPAQNLPVLLFIIPHAWYQQPEVAGLESAKAHMQTAVASFKCSCLFLYFEVLSEAALCGPRLWESLLQSCCTSPGQSQQASGGQEMG